MAAFMGSRAPNEYQPTAQDIATGYDPDIWPEISFIRKVVTFKEQTYKENYIEAQREYFQQTRTLSGSWKQLLIL